MRPLLALALVGACGRIDFTPRSDGAADSAGDVSGDAIEACAVRQLAVGERHVCALRKDGAVYCAGENAEGQLGTGSITAVTPFPVRASEWDGLGAPVASVHAGRQFTCVRDSAGMLFCLGENGNRQLGTPSASASTGMRVAAGVPPLASVSLGNTFGCGLTPGGEVYCWGDSDEGQGGIGVSPGSHTPELVVSLTAQGPTRVSAGTNHVCANIAGSNMVCWGDGGLFRLGYVATDNCPGATGGASTCQTQPGMLGTGGSLAVSAGHEHTCAVRTTGGVMCWGSNDRGQVGVAPSTSSGITPVAGLSDIVEVSAGRHFNCARDTMGRVSCWGAADLYQLGSIIGASESETPIEVVLPRPATSIVSHPMTQFTCATLDDGTATCWGANDFGQLGRGTMSTRELPAAFPVPCN